MKKNNSSSAGKVMLIDDHALVAEGFKGLLLNILPNESTVNIFSSIEHQLQEGGEFCNSAKLTLICFRPCIIS